MSGPTPAYWAAGVAGVVAGVLFWIGVQEGSRALLCVAFAIPASGLLVLGRPR